MSTEAHFMSSEDTIKNALKEGKAVLGWSAVERSAKRGDVGTIIYSSNCPGSTIKSIQYYSRVAGTESLEFSGNSTRLGQICGKPFNVTVIGIKK